MCILLFTLFDFSFGDFPSVLRYCWLGLLTCKKRLPYNLYCVGGDVKHCSIQSNTVLAFSVSVGRGVSAAGCGRLWSERESAAFSDVSVVNDVCSSVCINWSTYTESWFTGHTAQQPRVVCQSGPTRQTRHRNTASQYPWHVCLSAILPLLKNYQSAWLKWPSQIIYIHTYSFITQNDRTHLHKIKTMFTFEMFTCDCECYKCPECRL